MISFDGGVKVVVATQPVAYDRKEVREKNS